VLELGCGSGRNAIYLASLGCSVDAADGQGPCFGADFLWVLLAAKESAAGR
jgi:2-polyprenyl-3-methyl-5-hydroxy-6-metoxy-1,4-benzoquinol methylase